MTTVLNGVLGGLTVGALAALVTRVLAGDLAGTAAPLEGIAGSGAAASRWVALVVRLLYGGLAGGTLVALEQFGLGLLAVPPTAVEAFGVTVAWSALLFGTLTVVRRVTSPRAFTRSRLAGSFVYHLVYGLGLGLWIRMTWIT